MKTFNDLEFKPKQGLTGGERASMFFDNGYGVSVITGFGAYGSKDRPYELGVLIGNKDKSELCYTTPITDDVLGYLTADEVTKYMKEVQNLEKSEESK